jgi:hypothetical protein
LAAQGLRIRADCRQADEQPREAYGRKKPFGHHLFTPSADHSNWIRQYKFCQVDSRHQLPPRVLAASGSPIGRRMVRREHRGVTNPAGRITAHDKLLLQFGRLGSVHNRRCAANRYQD